ncbi:peptidoglycan DD-metalloendopeptidase family protein [Bacillus infantis]|uniref:peptidoglycan DD-metalloendopeptidase family protein n=1 Tax=Bacillus infantis TaxID=324767 RepID=UPI0030185D5A
MNQYNDDHQNRIAEIAKHKARKAIRTKAKVLLKKAGKAAARMVIHAAAAALKSLLSVLGYIGLPYILALGGILLILLMIYMGTTMLFSDENSALGRGGKELQSYIIQQVDSTVDMTRPEQIPYRVPHELIVSALQIYDSTKHGKTDKQAVQIMAKALKPVFQYDKYKGSIETEVTTCIDGECSTSKNETPFTIEPLTYVEAWDRVLNVTHSPHTTEWKTTVSESTATKTVPKRDKNGRVIPRQYETVTVPKKVTTKSRAHTYVPEKVEVEDYTYFDRVLSAEPFSYGQTDKLMVEALFQATGGYIRYKEWLTGNSLIGFNGSVTPGAGIPPEFMEYYLEAEKIYKVDWFYLAALHFVETGFSTHATMVSSVGAEGHLQFMPCTWLGWSYPSCSGSGGGGGIPDNIKYNPLMIQKYGGYGVDADKNGKATPWDVKDAIFTAASYLNKNGFSKNIDGAIYSYNHADWYVQKVKDNALRFKNEATYSPNAGSVPDLRPGSFMRPAKGIITSGFGYRNLGGKTSLHAGLDIASSEPDTPIVAASDGVITRVVTNCPPQGSYGNRCGAGFGNHVYIKHTVQGQTFEAVYAHMKRVGPIAVGQTVKQGQFLGIMGTSGSSTGVHLHFELHKGSKQGKANVINPALYIPT